MHDRVLQGLGAPPRAPPRAAGAGAPSITGAASGNSSHQASFDTTKILNDLFEVQRRRPYSRLWGSHQKHMDTKVFYKYTFAGTFFTSLRITIILTKICYNPKRSEEGQRVKSLIKLNGAATFGDLKGNWEIRSTLRIPTSTST